MFWQEKGKRDGWGLICKCRPRCTVSACSPFNSSHRKSNTIHISACRVQYISSYVCSFSLWKEKGESSSCHVMFENPKKKGGENMSHQATWGRWCHNHSFLLLLSCTLWSLKRRRSGYCSLPLSVFSSFTALDYITMHSLTHLLPSAPFPADG